MINEVYRLIAPKQIRVDFVDEQIGDSVVVRPTYLSICAADQRYYMGTRGKEVLSQKLPMALIHEAVGKVVFDPQKEFAVGENVVLIPNTPVETDEIIKENYLRSSKFRASGFDGFMQNVVLMDRGRIISFDKIPERTAVLLEVLSVILNAIENFEQKSHIRRRRIGIWGDGNLGFITALVLKTMYPDSHISVLGLTLERMHYFPFVDEMYSVNDLPDDFKIDHAFECVGGTGSESAINQIIDCINPQGSIVLMGVSENNVALNTRMVLEKGLLLLGNSRSGYSDFKKGIEFLTANVRAMEYMDMLISEEIEINSIKDMNRAFEHDKMNDFKTVMKWNI